MNGRRIRELLSSHPALAEKSAELDRLFGELLHAAASEWKDAQKGRELKQLEALLDVSHSDLGRFFLGTKKLGGRLFLLPPELLAMLVRELRIYQLLTSGERVEAEIRGGNASLVIALADLKWRSPRRIFVNSMSDLFHEALDFEVIAAIFGVMAAAPRHVFQLLTKRPERARAFFEWAKKHGDGYDLCRIEPSELLACAFEACSGDAWGDVVDPPGSLDMVPTSEVFGTTWPLPNVWLGVSVEDQATADERIPVLLELPAALRFVSYEPALGPVDFNEIRLDENTTESVIDDASWRGVPREHVPPGVDWIIVGGESGPGARPMHPAWARSVRDQCEAAGTAFFFKQWGEWSVTGPVAGGDLGGDMRAGRVMIVRSDREEDGHFRPGDVFMRRGDKKANGRELDGRLHDAFPEIRS